MNITFQVSLYPIAKEDFKTPINNFISELKKQHIDVTVHETSTIGSGDIDRVFNTLKNAYSSAAKKGDTVMVLTIVSGSPTKDELDVLNAK
ncbi:MAG: Ykof family thiamine-binding protein [Bacteroidetes bacterium]|nr:Ykof family thiamine-binding protein [Bacteroidota bacterium]